MSEKLGPTGKLRPEGPARPGDQGELRAGMWIENGKIILGFGAKVAWVAMTSEEARNFSTGLLKFAARLDKDGK